MSRALIAGAFALAALTGVLVLRSSSRGEGPSKETKAPAESHDRTPVKAGSKPSVQPFGQTAVGRALAEPAELKFVDTPLRDITAFIADRYKINVLLDTSALADAGVTSDTSFTVAITGTSLRSALALMLAPKYLSYFEGNGSELVITTADRANTRTTVQVYDVRKFTNSVNEFSPDPKPWARIAEIIKCSVAPASWNENGGAGSLRVLDGDMIVSQSDEHQSQIADLLSHLEAARQLSAGSNNRDLPVVLASAVSLSTRIDKALESRMDFEFTDTPLYDVVDMLKSKLDIWIQLDTKPLAEAGVTGEIKMSMQLMQTCAREGLQELLGTKNLDFVIDGDRLLITTADTAKTKTVTYLYPVGDLMVSADSDVTVENALGALAESISSSIAPSSWDNKGGVASIASFPPCKVLIVNQTRRLHQKIKELLTTLRATRKGNPPSDPLPINTRVVRVYSVPSANSKTGADEKGAEQLAIMIQKLVEPNSWADRDAFIGAVRGEIVVRQTPPIQYHVQSFLKALDVAPQVNNDAATLPPGRPLGGNTGIPKLNSK
jgi:hypothetical protein